MNKKSSELRVREETKNITEQKIDYSPKEYTSSQTILTGLKYFLIAGGILGFLWVIEMFIYK